LVIFYADKITESMQATIDETNRRRAVQMEYNRQNSITPRTVGKSKEDILNQKSILDIRGQKPKAYVEPEFDMTIAADPLVSYLDKDQIKNLITETEIKMRQAAKDLDFISAARYRDELTALKKKL
jgi:excinuclease ABC subunit B